MYRFKLPDIGEGTHEAEIIQWHVKVGDTVREDDTLVEIQSDKATADLPSPVDGVITELFGNEGEMALVGAVIVEIDTGDGGAASRKAPSQHKNEPAAKDAGHGTRRSWPDTPAITHRDAVDVDVDLRTLAVPRVRRFAREKGVDISAIEGTGRSGLVTMEDVEAYLARRTQPQPASLSGHTPESRPAHGRHSLAGEPTGGERREPMKGMRKATARALTAAIQTIPHVTIFDRAVVDDLVTSRNRLKPLAAERGVKLTYTPYVVRACAAMLKAHPLVNAYVDLDAMEIAYRPTCNVSVAIDTDLGLFVPVIRNADRLSLFEIARELNRLADLAQAGRLTMEDMSGGSMTITNVGGVAAAGVWSTPIINAPESVIVGIGRIEGEFLPDEDHQPVYHECMKLSFAFDHRLVDGVTAQRALNDLKTFISHPDYLLAEG